jgi:hypothetical protein
MKWGEMPKLHFYGKLLITEKVNVSLNVLYTCMQSLFLKPLSTCLNGTGWYYAWDMTDGYSE